MRSEEQRRKSMKLFEALSYVDESLIDRSAAKERGKIITILRINRVAAACLCMIAAGALTMAAGGLFRTGRTADSAMELARDMGNATSRAPVDEEAAMNYDCSEAEEGEEEAQELCQIAEYEPTEDERKGVEADRLQGSQVEDRYSYSEIVNEEDLKQDCDTLSDSYRTITWEEAAMLSVLGDFVPAKNWGEYTLEEVKAGYDPVREETIALRLVWTKGLDSMMYTVKILDQDSIFSESADKLHMADINKPETYDVRLYEIPYCDSVPEEFRETFLDPVFMLGEMNPDLVKSRMKTKEDAGDTNTPGGSFGILCDNILLHFNGSMDPDEVWDGIQTIISRLIRK